MAYTSLKSPSKTHRVCYVWTGYCQLRNKETFKGSSSGGHVNEAGSCFG